VLRRSAAGLEIVANGVFLVSAANAVSSRALVSAVWPYVPGDRLRVLIGGLGLGDALDEALACDRVAEVVVAELEPVIVRWFRSYGGAVAARVAAAERGGRARIVDADVVDALAAARGSWDVVALDTDNGPEWLVRAENAGLYSESGLRSVHDALRRGGAAVYWSPERYPAFERELKALFDCVVPVTAYDLVDGRRHEYTMYVALRDARAAGSG
jgi:spermidine synthase